MGRAEEEGETGAVRIEGRIKGSEWGIRIIETRRAPKLHSGQTEKTRNMQEKHILDQYHVTRVGSSTV